MDGWMGGVSTTFLMNPPASCERVRSNCRGSIQKTFCACSSSVT